jgi:hypothetical protein
MAVKIDWSEEARADIRAFDRSTAMFIFEGLLRYAQTGHGVSKLFKANSKTASACAAVITASSSRMSETFCAFIR